MKKLFPFVILLVVTGKNYSQNLNYAQKAQAELDSLYQSFKTKKAEFEKEKKTLDAMNASFTTSAEQNNKTKKLKLALDSLYKKQENYKTYYLEHKVTSKELDTWFPPQKDYKPLDDKAVADIKTAREKEEEQKETDSIHESLTFLNGTNFDFDNTKNKTGYIGNINIFLPIGKNNKWAINGGFRKINYSSNINNNSPRFQIDSLRIKPLDNVTSGKKYIQEYNKYSSNVKISSWSAYFQLMHRILPNIERIYVHFHSELLINDITFSTEVSNIQRDTVIATGDLNLGYKNPAETKFEKNKTFFGTYLGLGVTGDFKVVKTKNYTLNYFIQATVGFTNNQLNPNQKEDNTASSPASNPLYYTTPFIYNLDPQEHFFHVFHTYVSNKYNGINLILGTEVRGIFKYPPLYIFYVGLNTDLNKIAEIFK